MLLKEYCSAWPPIRMIGDIGPTADVEDVVLSIKKCSNPNGVLRLNLRNTSGGERTAAFFLPEFFQEQIIFSILQKEDMTLRDVGELPIAKTSFVEPVITTSQSSSLPPSPAKQMRGKRLFAALRLLYSRA